MNHPDYELVVARVRQNEMSREVGSNRIARELAAERGSGRGPVRSWMDGALVRLSEGAIERQRTREQQQNQQT